MSCFSICGNLDGFQCDDDCCDLARFVDCGVIVENGMCKWDDAGYCNLEGTGFPLVLTEESFYPPSDDRVLESWLDDVGGTDGFYAYARDFYDAYGDDLFESETVI